MRGKSKIAVRRVLRRRQLQVQAAYADFDLEERSGGEGSENIWFRFLYVQAAHERLQRWASR